jgi:hypothetical protein
MGHFTFKDTIPGVSTIPRGSGRLPFGTRQGSGIFYGGDTMPKPKDYERLLEMVILCAENAKVKTVIVDFDRFGESDSSGHERIFVMAFDARWMQIVKLLKQKKSLDRHFLAGGPIG